MNKTFCKKKVFLSFFFAGCLILFNLSFISCGLDTIYVIDAPSVIHEPIYSSIELPDRYFEFRTAEDYQEGITFLGTEVFYKIYDSSSKMISESSSINSAASNESTANQSASRLIESYKYQTLRHSNDTGANILIPKGSSKRVKIRLANDPEYDSEFTIGSKLGIPVRNIPGNKPEDKSFSFKELGSDKLPKGGENSDPDYAYSSTTEEITEYYVALFAVSVAQDNTYSLLYSTAVYLGSVTIPLE